MCMASSSSQIQYDAGARIESDSWGFINPYTYTDSSSQVRQGGGRIKAGEGGQEADRRQAVRQMAGLRREAGGSGRIKVWLHLV